MRAIERDFYTLVPAHLQQPLSAFLCRGIEPADPQLKAELNGRLHNQGYPPLSSIAGCDRGRITTFLNRHANRFDIAHGHPGYVVRWMMRGGERGRADGLLT